MNVSALIIVIIFLVFDIVTGWLQALATNTTNSSIMRKGLFHKLAEILAVCFGYICEYTFPLTGVTVNIPLAGGIAAYIVVMETASIVENLCKLNPTLNAIMGKFFDEGKLKTVPQEGKHDEKK